MINTFRKISIIVALVFGYVLCANGQSAAYLDALKLYYSDKNEDAYSAFKALEKSESDNDAIYFYIAMLSTEEAERELYLEKAVGKDPNNFWYNYYLALQYAASGNTDLAVEHFEMLIERNPKRTSLYFNLIDIYADSNQIDKAISVIDTIESKSGKNQNTAIARVQLLLAQKKTVEAYGYLEEFYNESKSPRIAAMLAEYYHQRMDSDRAIELYEEALDMDPTQIATHYGIAHIYRETGDIEKYFYHMNEFFSKGELPPALKVQYIEELLAQPQFVSTFLPQVDTMVMNIYNSHPQDTSVLVLSSQFFWQSGKRDKAISLAQKMIGLNPDNLQAYVDHSAMLYYAEDWESVVKSSSMGLQRFPKDRSLLELRAISYWRLEDYDKSLADFKTKLAVAPTDSVNALQCYASMGDLYHELGDTKNSYQAYEKALKIEENYTVVLNNYAYHISLAYPQPVKRVDKNLKKALEMSRKTIEAEPDNATYLDTYAWILHLCGMDIEAKAHFKHAMIYGGKESKVILEHYAIVLETLGEKELANIYRNRAKSIIEE
jgi:tetratricopeptide (TPR) repeat protein